MDGVHFGTRKTPQQPLLRIANEVRCLIVTLTSLMLLVGCDSLGMRNYLAADQVPQSAKDQPRLVESPPTPTGNEAWPQLGDVPSKPNDFSPKPVYDHYMDELAYDRGEAQSQKKEIENEDVVNGMASSSQSSTPQMPSATQNTPQGNTLVPPQFLNQR